MAKFLIKIDDLREEKIEVFLANILEKYDNFKNADEIRIAINKAIIDAVLLYASGQGIDTKQVPEEVKIKIAKEGAKLESKINKKLQKQLRKTSKKYKERHDRL